MEMVRQDADSVRFERQALLDRTINLSQVRDMLDQQTAGAVSKHNREKEHPAVDFRAPISRHDRIMARAADCVRKIAQTPCQIAAPCRAILHTLPADKGDGRLWPITTFSAAQQLRSIGARSRYCDSPKPKIQLAHYPPDPEKLQTSRQDHAQRQTTQTQYRSDTGSFHQLDACRAHPRHEARTARNDPQQRRPPQQACPSRPPGRAVRHGRFPTMATASPR